MVASLALQTNNSPEVFGIKKALSAGQSFFSVVLNLTLFSTLICIYKFAHKDVIYEVADITIV